MIGTLRHKIMLVDYTPTKDGVGDWESSPLILWQGWAGAERIGDARNQIAQQTRLDQTYLFRVREQALPVYQNTRLIFNNWEFVISAIENEDERSRYMLITGTSKRKVPSDLTPIQSILEMRIAEFEVAAGAPMEDGDTVFTSSSFPLTATFPIVFADGVRQPYTTGNGRSVAYNSDTNTITFSSPVFEGEIIAIYA